MGITKLRIGAGVQTLPRNNPLPNVNNRGLAISKKNLELRKRLWPDVKPDHVWNRKTNDGYASVPRVLPFVMRAMDALAEKGKPLSSTYCELWLRTNDEMFIVVSDPHEMAFAAGFDGSRAKDTWAGRIDALAKLGFIKLAPGAHGDRSYILILHPDDVMEKLKKKIPAQFYNTYASRAARVGAVRPSTTKAKS
jgi:hypothetical protein